MLGTRDVKKPYWSGIYQGQLGRNPQSSLSWFIDSAVTVPHMEAKAGQDGRKISPRGEM